MNWSGGKLRDGKRKPVRSLPVPVKRIKSVLGYPTPMNHNNSSRYQDRTNLPFESTKSLDIIQLEMGADMKPRKSKSMSLVKDTKEVEIAKDVKGGVNEERFREDFLNCEKSDLSSLDTRGLMGSCYDRSENDFESSEVESDNVSNAAMDMNDE